MLLGRTPRLVCPPPSRLRLVFSAPICCKKKKRLTTLTRVVHPSFLRPPSRPSGQKDRFMSFIFLPSHLPRPQTSSCDASDDPTAVVSLRPSNHRICQDGLPRLSVLDLFGSILTCQAYRGAAKFPKHAVETLVACSLMQFGAEEFRETLCVSHLGHFKKGLAKFTDIRFARSIAGVVLWRCAAATAAGLGCGCGTSAVPC